MEEFADQFSDEKYQKINQGLKEFVAEKRPEIEKEINTLEKGLEALWTKLDAMLDREELIIEKGNKDKEFAEKEYDSAQKLGLERATLRNKLTSLKTQNDNLRVEIVQMLNFEAVVRSRLEK